MLLLGDMTDCIDTCLAIAVHLKSMRNHLNVQDAPLPPEWQEFEDEKQNTFFFNSVTETSSYEHPYDALYQRLYAALSR